MQIQYEFAVVVASMVKFSRPTWINKHCLIILLDYMKDKFDTKMWIGVDIEIQLWQYMNPMNWRVCGGDVLKTIFKQRLQRPLLLIDSGNQFVRDGGGHWSRSRETNGTQFWYLLNSCTMTLKIIRQPMLG